MAERFELLEDVEEGAEETPAAATDDESLDMDFSLGDDDLDDFSMDLGDELGIDPRRHGAKQ